MTQQMVLLRDIFARPCMDAMNFLNEAAARYPSAISFAAGRPPDTAEPVLQARKWVAAFAAEEARRTGRARADIWRSLGQYGPSSGIIQDYVARWLARDEGLHPGSAELVITNGMQEALLLLLLTVCEQSRDVVLADDPTYVGLDGAAALAGRPVLRLTGEGSLVDRVQRALRSLRAGGQRARVLYVVPDFSNPLGVTLTLGDRRALLELAYAERLLVIEDVAYRSFRYEGTALPSMKELDTSGCVVQIGSFSKLFLPGPRIAYIYADQTAEIAGAGPTLLARELGKAKSHTSVLTSPLTQAVVAGFLLEHDFTLAAWLRPRIERCRANRDALLAAWEGLVEVEPAVRGAVRWTRPEGGYFLTLELPFAFGPAEMLQCASDYGVLVCPMSMFSDSPRFASSIRIAFSSLTPDAARAGAERLFRYVRDRNLTAVAKGATV